MNVSLELTGIALVGMAAWALWFARQQVLEMQKTNQEMQKTNKANVLLSLDQRWESEPILSARADLQMLIESVRAEATQRWPGLSEAERKRRSSEIFAEKLQQMRIAADKTRYLQLFRICGFLETLGYVAATGYLPVKDVINLLGGSILTAEMVFNPHMDKLLNEEGADKRMYECCRWLFEETKKHAAIGGVAH